MSLINSQHLAIIVFRLLVCHSLHARCRNAELLSSASMVFRVTNRLGFFSRDNLPLHPGLRSADRPQKPNLRAAFSILTTRFSKPLLCFRPCFRCALRHGVAVAL